MPVVEMVGREFFMGAAYLEIRPELAEDVWHMAHETQQQPEKGR